MLFLISRLRNTATRNDDTKDITKTTNITIGLSKTGKAHLQNKVAVLAPNNG